MSLPSTPHQPHQPHHRPVNPPVAAHARVLAQLHQHLLPFGWGPNGLNPSAHAFSPLPAVSAVSALSADSAHSALSALCAVSTPSLDPEPTHQARLALLSKDDQSILEHWQADFEHHFASLSPAQALASELLHHAHQEPASFWGQMLESCRLAALALFFEDDEAQLIAAAWIRSSSRRGRLLAASWPQAWEDFSTALPPTPNHALPALGLYPVLPDAQWVQRMVDVGVPTVQLRFKSEDPKAIGREVRAAVRAVQSSQTRLFINDHWEQAMGEGAYGLHLGQEDFEVAPMETIRQSKCVLGLSTHGYVEMLKAAQHAPGYLALGAVFPTTLKQMKTNPQGLGRLRAYASLMKSFSLVGIGGIDESQFKAVQACGVGSIAVVRAIVAHTEPELQAQHLMSYF